MFSRKKIAAVSGLVAGIAASCVGIPQAYAANPGTCTNDLLGNLTCTQRIQGSSEDGALPHQETCKPVQPTMVPAVLGTGMERLGPEVTCNPSTVGVSPDSPTVGVPASSPAMGVPPGGRVGRDSMGLLR